MSDSRETLLWIERCLAAGDQRISAQIRRIERMTARGSDISEAKQMLNFLEVVQEEFYASRKRMLDASWG